MRSSARSGRRSASRSSEERGQALCDASKLVALHICGCGPGPTSNDGCAADLVSTALEGGVNAGEAVRRLGFADQPGIVLALALPTSSDGGHSGAQNAQLVLERQRISDAFAMHLTAVQPRSAAALVDDVAYGILPVPRDGPSAEERAVRIASEFLDRIGDREQLVIGIGALAQDGASLARSRAGADRALRVLRGGGARRLALIGDVNTEALLFELGDLIAERGDPITGPVTRLAEYDAKHRTCLVETLRAWLDAFGDTVAASASLYVHPNTFRYRLRRVGEVGGIDITDSNARFAATLQLRLERATRSRAVSGGG